VIRVEEGVYAEDIEIDKSVSIVGSGSAILHGTIKTLIGSGNVAISGLAFQGRSNMGIYVAGQTTNPSLSRLRITLGGVVFVDSAGGTLSAVDISGRGDGGAAIVVGMQATPRLRSWAGIGNLAAIHPIGAGDDATLHRLPEHLGETDHWHGAGTRNDYRPTLVRVRLSVEIALSLKTKAIALIGGRRAEPLSFSALLLAINSR
jgi:hypothetical protein